MGIASDFVQRALTQSTAGSTQTQNGGGASGTDGVYNFIKQAIDSNQDKLNSGPASVSTGADAGRNDAVGKAGTAVNANDTRGRGNRSYLREAVQDRQNAKNDPVTWDNFQSKLQQAQNQYFNYFDTFQNHYGVRQDLTEDDQRRLDRAGITLYNNKDFGNSLEDWKTYGEGQERQIKAQTAQLRSFLDQNADKLNKDAADEVREQLDLMDNYSGQLWKAAYNDEGLRARDAYKRAGNAYTVAEKAYNEAQAKLKDVMQNTATDQDYDKAVEAARQEAKAAEEALRLARNAYEEAGGLGHSYSNEDRVSDTIKGAMQNSAASSVDAFRALWEKGEGQRLANDQPRIAQLDLAARTAQTEYFRARAAAGGNEDDPAVKAAKQKYEEARDFANRYQGIVEGDQGLAEKAATKADDILSRSQLDIARAKEGASNLTQGLVDVGVAGTQLATDAAISAMTGIPSMALLGIRSFGGGTQQARLGGGNIDQQLAYGAANAAVEMMTEKMADGLAGMFGKGAADDVAEAVIGKLAQSDAGRTALRTIYGMMGEGAEEFISSAIDPALRSIYNGKTAKENYSEEEISDWLYDALIGAALALPGAGISTVTGQNAQKNAELRMADNMRMSGLGSVANQTDAAWNVLSGRYSPEQQANIERYAQNQLGIENPATQYTSGQQATPEEQAARQTVRTILESGRVNNTAANQILNDPALRAAAEYQTGLSFDGMTTEEARTALQRAARNGAYTTAQFTAQTERAATADSARAQAALEEEAVRNNASNYDSYIRGILRTGADTQTANEILNDPTLKEVWERMTGKTLPENRKSAVKMLRETTRSNVGINVDSAIEQYIAERNAPSQAAENAPQTQDVSAGEITQPTAQTEATGEAQELNSTPTLDSGQAEIQNRLNEIERQLETEQRNARLEEIRNRFDELGDVDNEEAKALDEEYARLMHESALDRNSNDYNSSLALTDAMEKAGFKMDENGRFIYDGKKVGLRIESLISDLAHDRSVDANSIAQAMASISERGGNTSIADLVSLIYKIDGTPMPEWVRASYAPTANDARVNAESNAQYFKDIASYFDALQKKAAKEGNAEYAAKMGDRAKEYRAKAKAATAATAETTAEAQTEAAQQGTQTPPQGQTQTQEQTQTDGPTMNPTETTTEESTNGRGNERERGGSANARSNGNVEVELRQAFANEPLMYHQLTNAEVTEKANAIMDKGLDEARSEVEKAIGAAKAGMKLSPEHFVAGFMVANELSRNGDVEAGHRLMADLFAEQTAAGQLGQLGRLVRMQAPAVATMTVENIIGKMNQALTDGQKLRNIRRGIGNESGEISVNPALLQDFAKAVESKNDDQINAAIDAIRKDIGRQIPATFSDKFTALRYLNMLGNLKTQIRNIVGNTAMMAATNAKYSAQTLFESLASIGGKYQRNTALFTNAELRDMAKKDFEANLDEIKGQSKYSDYGKQIFQGVQDERTIFGSGENLGTIRLGGKDIEVRKNALENARRLTNWAMDAGDVIFMKSVYTRAFAGWMKAHGINEASAATTEQIQQARKFAMREAQEATFHDDNVVSDFVSKLGRGDNTPAAVTAGIEGIMPFRKTPANVGVRAFEYSPIGLAETIFKAYQKGKGKATGADVINSLAKNATGSALFAAGMFLRAASKARASGDDDDKELNYFRQMRGESNYSIKIGDSWVSLSQFAPMSIPFFMGVKMEELREDSSDGWNLDSFGDLLGVFSEPMLEMSMLSGVNDFFNDMATLSGDTDAIVSLVGNAALGYLSQGLTNTLLGQAEQAMEENRQTTYADTKSADATEFDRRVSAGLQKKLGKYSAKIPGIDYHQQDYVDAWGRTQSNGNAAERVVNAFLNPTYVTDDRSTEVDAELERLHTANRETEGFPNVLPQTTSRNTLIGDGIVMTPDEYRRFSVESGQSKLNLVRDFMNSKQYKGMSDAERAQTIHDLYELADDRALQKVRDNYGITKKSDWDDEAQLSNPAQYLAAKAVLGADEPNYKHMDDVFRNWGSYSSDTQAALKGLSGVNNMRFAYDELGMGTERYNKDKAAIEKYETEGLEGEEKAAADALIITKHFKDYSDAEKLKTLEAQNPPTNKQTGKRAAIVRRYDAAMNVYGIPFDTWTKVEAYLQDAGSTKSSVLNQASKEAGLPVWQARWVYYKDSGNEKEIDVYNDFFPQDYVAKEKPSYLDYLEEAATEQAPAQNNSVESFFAGLLG